MLHAKKSIQPGEVIIRVSQRSSDHIPALQESPFIIAPVSPIELYARFLLISREEIEFLSTVNVNVHALTSTDEAEIQRVAGTTSSFQRPFRWFYALMKSHAHGIAPNVPFWAIYRNAVKARHSCDPNCCYRNENGTLVYVAIRAIAENEPITVPYVDTLFASKSFRQSRLLRQKLFICQCSKCLTEVDMVRRVWCPHCRTKIGEKTPAFATFVGRGSGLKHLRQFELTKQVSEHFGWESLQMNPGKPGEEDYWLCTDCNMIYTSSVLPVAVESTLESLYERLDSQFASPSAASWFNYLTYLYNTVMTVLGPMHWLYAGCQFLYSRYYLGLWNGGAETNENRDLCMKYGKQFIEYIESVAKEAISVDLLPWVSALMRMCLFAGDVSTFTDLTSKFLVRLRIIYGSEDTTIQAYEEVIRIFYAHAKDTRGKEASRGRNIIAQMRAAAVASQRPTVDLTKFKKVVPKIQRIWLKTNQLKFDFLELEKQSSILHSPEKPWNNPADVQPAFLKLAEEQLAHIRTSNSLKKPSHHPIVIR